MKPLRPVRAITEAATHIDLQTGSDPETDDFKGQVFFMFSLPGAMLVFLVLCAAVTICST